MNSESTDTKEHSGAINGVEVQPTPQKGGFRLTSRECELLEFVIDQKFASQAMLYFRFYQAEDSKSSRYAYERLRLLCQNEFLVSVRVCTERETYYLATPRARVLLQGIRPDRLVQEPAERIYLGTFEHDKRVSWCRAYREKAGLAREWRSERKLKQEFAHRPTRLAQQSGYRLAREWMPDAIYTNKAGGKVAFELELSPKTKERYANKVAKFLEVMKDPNSHFSRVLYVCCSDSVYGTLCHLTSPYQERFRVMRYSDVVSNSIPLVAEERSRS